MPSFVDVSGRAVISLSGPESLDLLQRISTNDVLSVRAGRSAQTVLTNEKGRIVDVISVASFGDGKILIIGQSTKSKVLFSWIEKFIIMEEIEVEDLTAEFTCRLLFDFKLSPEDFQAKYRPKSFGFVEETWAGERIVTVLTEKANEAASLDELRRMGFTESSRDQYEKFRVIHGIPGSSGELTELYNPLEANLSSLIAWTKGCYVGQEVIARLDTYNKIQKLLSRMTLRELPSELPQVLYDEEGEAGTITSAVKAEDEGECCALGYVKAPRGDGRRRFYYSVGERRIPVFIKPNLS